VPVGLSGAFDDFGLDVNPFILTGKAIALVTSPIHVPIRRVFRKGAPPDGGKACAKAWRTTVFHADPGEAGEASLGDDSSGETTPEKAPKTRKTYKEQPESILDEIN
jgi:hypothetical protein